MNSVICFTNSTNQRIRKTGKFRRVQVSQPTRRRVSCNIFSISKRIDIEKNEVVLAKDEDLYCKTVICRDINYMSIEGLCRGREIRCKAKIRYRHAPEDAVAELTKDGLLQLTFDEPVRAAAPGQAAVMYDDEKNVIGGGTIWEARN